MRLRKLALAVGLAGAMSAEMASALGLGEIKLNSSLNEPLDAEIKLLQTRDLDEGEILVALAGKDDFQKAGVDRTFFLNDLKFKVHLQGTSGSVIRVTSSKPVREPYLNFLLQTQWPNGRILREYTLLMDLPVFSQETAKPVIRQQATTPKPVAQPQKKQPEPRQTIVKPQAPTKQTPPSSAPQSASAASSYGPVQSSDTLWEIALKVRPDRSVSVHKTMLAIQRLNPEAFINGNINLLRKGQVLRVPDAQEINELSRQEAVSQVAVQNREWSDSRASVSGPQLDASTRFDADRPKASKVEGRLTLAATEKVDAARTGQMGGSGSDADAESLQNELAISLEELDKSKRENAELNDRIRELEDQIGTMERLIEVSNQELRALQLANKVRSGEITESEAQAAAEEEAAAMAAQQAAMVQQADGSEGESELFSEAEDPMAADEGSEGDAEEAAQAQPAPAEPVVANTAKDNTSKVVSAPAPKPGLMDTLMENLALIGGGAAAIFLAVLLLLRRRKPEEETTLESYDSEMDQPPELVDDESIEDDAELVADEDVVDPADIDDEVLDEEDFNTESETGDAVAEADIYIAYGKFDQAEEMLVKAIDSGDNAREARLKLLEVYAESDNLTAFDQQYAAVLSMNDDEASARGAELREQFSNAPAFDLDSVESAAEVSPEFDLDLDDADESTEFDSGDGLPDLDFELEGVDETTESQGEDEAFDFDLDLDSDIESETEDDGLTLDLDGDTEVADADLDLDLDLELDETSSEEGFELDLEGNQDTDETQSDEFSLDVEGLEELEGGESIDLEIDGDSDISFESEETDQVPGLDSLTEDLGEMGESESASEADTDLTLDDDEEGFQTFDMDETTLEPDVPEDADEEDFDLSGDFDGDLASLDEEMEELSADLDSVEESDEAFGEAALEIETEASDVDLEDVTDLSLDTELAVDEVEGLDNSAEEGLDVSLDAAESLEEMEASSDDISFDAEEFSISAEDLEMDAEAVDLGEDFALEEAQDLEDISLDLEDEAADTLEMPESLEADLADLESVESEEATQSEPATDLELETAEEDLDDDLDLSVEDEVFSEALSGVPASDDTELAQDLPEAGAEAALDEDDLEAELDFLSDTDEVATKLDLARAYIDMGDHDGAKDILDEVVQEGSDEQKKEAEELLSKV